MFLTCRPGRQKVLCSAILIVVFIYVYYNLGNSIAESQQSTSGISATTTEKKSDLKKSWKGPCVIPELDPWADEVTPWVKQPEPLNCTEIFPKLFDSTLSSVVPVVSPEVFESLRIRSCCYRQIERPVSRDYSFWLSPTCTAVSLNGETKIPANHEFISIECTKTGTWLWGFGWETTIIDMHAFPSRPIQNIKKVSSSSSAPNVLLLGFDSVARMNFLRTMARSQKFLKEKLSVIEMRGFNRVGSFTYQNLIPIMSSRTPPEFERCISYSSSPVDNCPFIWRKYKAKGYMTGFSEDTSSTFHLEFSGFSKPPTDFYLRPLMLAVKAHIGGGKRMVYDLCAGPRLWFQVLLNYVQKVVEATAISKLPLFFFNWIGGLAHDDAGYLYLGDEPFLQTLQWLHESNHLNNTILVIFADHGLEYGELRNTRQGNTEANLPVMYFVLPSWFQSRYERAYKNLVGNSDRLTTAYDFHATLENLLFLDELNDDQLLAKENEVNLLSLPRGISLFLPIPPERSCEDAEIHSYYCTCNRKTIPISVDDPEVIQSARVIVEDINERLVNNNAGRKCAHLSLAGVQMAQRRISGDGEEDGLVITLETDPGKGKFEAVVKRQHGKIVLDSDTFRTNAYGNQSHCVDSRFSKMYCYCLE